MERIAVTLFYGSLLGVMGLFAWRSKSVALQKIAMWMALDWALYNIGFYIFGPSREAWVGPTMTAIIAFAIGVLAVRAHSRAAWVIVGIYLGEEVVSVASFAAHAQDSRAYFTVLNVLFLCRLLVVTGVAAYGLAIGLGPVMRSAARGGAYRAIR